jgi:hypothetical protein
MELLDIEEYRTVSCSRTSSPPEKVEGDILKAINNFSLQSCKGENHSRSREHSSLVDVEPLLSPHERPFGHNTGKI